MSEKFFSLYNNQDLLQWLDSINLKGLKEKMANRELNGFDLSIAGRDDLKNELEIESFHDLNNLCKHLNLAILNQVKVKVLIDSESFIVQLENDINLTIEALIKFCQDMFKNKEIICITTKNNELLLPSVKIVEMILLNPGLYSELIIMTKEPRGSYVNGYGVNIREEGLSMPSDTVSSKIRRDYGGKSADINYGGRGVVGDYTEYNRVPTPVRNGVSDKYGEKYEKYQGLGNEARASDITRNIGAVSDEKYERYSDVPVYSHNVNKKDSSSLMDETVFTEKNKDISGANEHYPRFRSDLGGLGLNYEGPSTSSKYANNRFTGGITAGNEREREKEPTKYKYSSGATANEAISNTNANPGTDYLSRDRDYSRKPLYANVSISETTTINNNNDYSSRPKGLGNDHNIDILNSTNIADSSIKQDSGGIDTNKYRYLSEKRNFRGKFS